MRKLKTAQLQKGSDEDKFKDQTVLYQPECLHLPTGPVFIEPLDFSKTVLLR